MISRGPRAAMAPLTARFNSSALLVSPWKALACPAAFLMRPAVSSAELPSRSIAATGKPFPASANAMARPMPEPAPVTMAIRLFGAIDVGSSSFAQLFAQPTVTQPSPCRSRRASQLFPLSPRLLARGERLSSFTQLSPPRSRRASQLFHSALASSLAASVSARRAILSRGRKTGSRAHAPSRGRVRVSDGHGVAVAAWVGAGHQRSGFRITRDPLPAAHHPRPVIDHVHVVPTLSEALPCRLGNARLRVEKAVAVDTDARLLDGFLDVEAELERVQKHLRLRLQDAVGAGRAHTQREGALLEDLNG